MIDPRWDFEGTRSDTETCMDNVSSNKNSLVNKNQGQHYKNNVFTKVWAVGLLLEPYWFLFQPDELLPFWGLGS